MWKAKLILYTIGLACFTRFEKIIKFSDFKRTVRRQRQFVMERVLFVFEDIRVRERDMPTEEVFNAAVQDPAERA